MNNKEYLIFYEDPPSTRECFIDETWEKVDDDEWSIWRNNKWRWYHQRESQIILIDLQTLKPIIIKDKLNRIISIAVNPKDEILYFIESDDSREKDEQMYSLQFFRYFGFVKMYYRLLMKTEITDDITEIICKMLGEYGTILNEMNIEKGEIYFDMDYCAKTKRLYCGKAHLLQSGDQSGSLWYYNLDDNDNKDEDDDEDEKVLVERNLSTTTGVCVDDIGIVYHGGTGDQYGQPQGADIVAYSGIDEDKRHRMDILVNVARCKDICYYDGYVYFLGEDMIARINVKTGILRYMLGSV